MLVFLMTLRGKPHSLHGAGQEAEASQGHKVTELAGGEGRICEEVAEATFREETQGKTDP